MQRSPSHSASARTSIAVPLGLALVGLLLGLAFAAPSAAATNVGGIISVDTTWTSANSPYIVTSQVTVQGTDGADGITTLTIEPGVEVRFNANFGLQVGTNSASLPGRLIADGVSGNPITFTSNQATKARGDWSYISIYDYAADTTLIDNAVIEYGGSSTANLYVYYASPTISNTVIRESSTHGAYITGASPTLSGNNVTLNDNHGVYVYSAANPSLTGNTFSNNGQYGVYVEFGNAALTNNAFNANAQRPLRFNPEDPFTGNTFQASTIKEIDLIAATIEVDRTLPAHVDSNSGLPLAYIVTGSINVQGTSGGDGVTALTLAPGVEMRFDQSRSLTIGTGSASLPGALDASGTQAQPIVLTSNQAVKTRGWWSGVYLYDYASDVATKMENITIEYGGSSANLYINQAHPKLGNCTIREGSQHGVYLYFADATLTGCTIRDNSKHGIYVYSSDAVGVRVTGSTLQGNGLYGVYLEYGSRLDVTDSLLKNNAQRPLRLHPNSLFTNNVYEGNVIQEIEFNGGTQSFDRTWPRLTDNVSAAVLSYVLVGQLTVQGTDGADGVTTLTVAPGVTVQFGQSQSMTIGSNSATLPGGLVADGSGALPVLFTSHQAVKTRGYWSNIYFGEYSQGSVLENVTIEYGGSSSSYMVYLYTNALTLTDVTLRQSLGSGLYLYNADPTIVRGTFSNNAVHGVHNYFGDPVISASTFQANGRYGVYTDSGKPSVTASHFQANSQRPLRVHPESPIQGNTFNGNVIHEVEFNAGTQALDQTLARILDQTSNASLVYVYTGGVTVQGTDGADGVTSLTVAPGVTVAFDQYATMTIGSNSAAFPGALVADGTAALPIVFTSHQTVKTKGWWGPLTFYNEASEAIGVLRNVTIEYGGRSTAGVYMYQFSPTVSDCTISNSGTHGVYLYDADPAFERCTIGNNLNHGVYSYASSGPIVRDSTLRQNSQYGLYAESGKPSVTNTLFKQNTQRPLRVAPDSDIAGNTFETNTIQEIEFLGGIHTLDKTLVRHTDAISGAPLSYVYTGTINIYGLDGADGTTTLTVSPGITVAFDQYAAMYVGGNSASQPGALVADGTAALPIIFTSHQSGTKTAGWWGPLTFYDFSADGSPLRNITIEYGGRSSAGVYLYNASPTLEDCVIHRSGTHGVYVYIGEPTLRACTVSNSATHGIYVYVGAPIIKDALLKDNAQYGLYNEYGARAEVTSSTLQGNKQRPLRIHPESAFSANTYRSNVIQEIEFNQGTVDMDVVLPKILDADTAAQLKYVYTGSVTFQGTDGPDGITSLTVAPGVTVAFELNAAATFGGSATLPGALHATGTAAEPIVFTSRRASPAAGDWGGLRFSNSNAPSQLENVTVGWAGQSSYGNVYIYGSDVTLRNSRFYRSSTYGVNVANTLDFTVSGNTMDLNVRGLYLAGSNTRLIVEGNHLHNNSFGLYVDGSTTATVRGNRIFDNTNRGVYFVGHDSLIYNNVFRNNVNAEDTGPRNLWNVTKVAASPGANIIGGGFFGGNRWSNYTGLDKDYDGLGDTLVPHKTIGNGRDHHPLTTLSEVIPDPNPPVTTATYNGTLGNAGWWRSAVTVTLNATDDSSGVKATYYRVNGGALQTYAGPFTFSNEGANAIEYWSVDNANNTEATKTGSASVDATAPVTSAALAGTPGPGGWYASDVTVTLSASDAASGISTTEIRVDGAGFFQPYTAPRLITGDGSHLVEFRSTDVAGNNETTKSVQVRIDTLPPTTTHLLAGTAGSNGWWRSSVNATLNATDAGSGVATTQRRLDGGAWAAYAGVLGIAGQGAHRLDYYSVDNVGHVEATKGVDVSIDSVPPATAFAVSAPSWQDATGLYITNASRVSLSATDATSGVASTQVQVALGGAFADAQDQGLLPILLGGKAPLGLARELREDGVGVEAFSEYAGPFSITGADGARTVSFFSRDVAGNQEAQQNRVVKLDNTAPNVQLARPRLGSISAFSLYAETDSDWDASPDALEQSLGTRPYDATSRPFTLPQPIAGIHANLGYAYVVAGTLVPIAATASDPIVNGVASGMDRVDFYVDGALLASDASAPYAVDWETSGVPFGVHNLTVRAFDHLGNQREHTVRVFVLAIPADQAELMAGLRALLPPGTLAAEGPSVALHVQPRAFAAMLEALDAAGRKGA